MSDDCLDREPLLLPVKGAGASVSGVRSHHMLLLEEGRSAEDLPGTVDWKSGCQMGVVGVTLPSMSSTIRLSVSGWNSLQGTTLPSAVLLTKNSASKMPSRHESVKRVVNSEVTLGGTPSREERMA